MREFIEEKLRGEKKKSSQNLEESSKSQFGKNTEENTFRFSDRFLELFFLPGFLLFSESDTVQRQPI